MTCSRFARLVGFSLLLALGACGDDVPVGPRLRLQIMPIDGPLPEGLIARPIDRPGADETYPLVPVTDGVEGEYVLPGAPGGVYRVEAPGGWQSLQGNRMPPKLEPGTPPPMLQLGHPRTVYILPAGTAARAGTRWGAWRLAPDGGAGEPISLQVLRGPQGYIAALRFPPDAWHGDIEIAGDVLLAVPGNEEAGALRGPLAQPYRFQPNPDGRPVLIVLQFAPTAPLAVALIPVGGKARPDGTRARVEVKGLPIEFAEETVVLEGTVRLPRVPSVDRPLALHLGDDAEPLRIESQLWQQSPVLYVLDAPPSTSRRIRVKLPEGTRVLQAVARTEEGTAFGLIPIDVVGTVGTLRVPAEVEEVFLDAGKTWAHLEGEDLDKAEVVPAFERTFVYQGTVRGKLEGATIRLFRQIGERAFSGQGFEIPVPVQGTFHARFPVGRYLVEVVSPRGVRKREQLLVVEEPQQFHVRLDAP